MKNRTNLLLLLRLSLFQTLLDVHAYLWLICLPRLFSECFFFSLLASMQKRFHLACVGGLMAASCSHDDPVEGQMTICNKHKHLRWVFWLYTTLLCWKTDIISSDQWNVYGIKRHLRGQCHIELHVHIFCIYTHKHVYKHLVLCDHNI